MRREEGEYREYLTDEQRKEREKALLYVAIYCIIKDPALCVGFVLMALPFSSFPAFAGNDGGALSGREQRPRAMRVVLYFLHGNRRVLLIMLFEIKLQLFCQGSGMDYRTHTLFALVKWVRTVSSM